MLLDCFVHSIEAKFGLSSTLVKSMSASLKKYNWNDSGVWVLLVNSVNSSESSFMSKGLIIWLRVEPIKVINEKTGLPGTPVCTEKLIVLSPLFPALSTRMSVAL